MEAAPGIMELVRRDSASHTCIRQELRNWTQGQILAVRIWPRNSQSLKLEFCRGFLSGFLPPVFSKGKKRPQKKKSTKKSPAKFTQDICSEKFPSDFCRSLFLINQQFTYGVVSEGQDAFDHDKGQKSVISGRRLDWIFFGIFHFFQFLQVFCVISKEIAPKCGENCPIPGAEEEAQNPVTSLAVMVVWSQEGVLRKCCGKFAEICKKKKKVLLRQETLRAQRLKKNWISLEIFNLAWKINPDLLNFPQKIGVWWVARLKCSISLENFNPGGRPSFVSIFGPLKKGAEILRFPANLRKLFCNDPSRTTPLVRRQNPGPFFWPRGSVQRYGCIPRSARTTLEIPKKLGAPNLLFWRVFGWRERFGTRPCRSPSRFGIRMHFFVPLLPLPNSLRQQKRRKPPSQKNPRAHKNKIGTSPPQNPNPPPP